MRKIPEIIIKISRKLRKDMTNSEKILWNELRSKRFNKIKFIRQAPIYLYTEDS